jgi:hypothetical protein
LLVPLLLVLLLCRPFTLEIDPGFGAGSGSRPAAGRGGAIAMQPLPPAQQQQGQQPAAPSRLGRQQQQQQPSAAGPQFTLGGDDTL